MQAALRLQKLLIFQLGLRSDCAGIHAFLSRDEWMLAKTPPTAKHWTLTVSEMFRPGPRELKWLLSGPGQNHRGQGNASQVIEDVCAFTS